MVLFGLLIFALTVISLAVLWRGWIKDWEGAPLQAKAGFLGLPWLPFTFIGAYNFLYGPELTYYKPFLGLYGFFALGASVVNIYRSLWSTLLRMSRQSQFPSPGVLLLRISLAIVLTITGIVVLFSLGFALVTYLYDGTGTNYIAEGLQIVRRVEVRDFTSFFYFSSVTYFSLGYGDYVPKGKIMLLLVYLEALLGYVNSGILVAYAFHLFIRLSSTGARIKRSIAAVPRKISLYKGFFK